jgi:signal transduction histidine kinase
MDVSEIREAERATREARDVAHESLRAKSEFITNISRELKTPLQSILGFSELGIVRGQQCPNLQAMFIDINTSGTRMVAMIKDLLTIAKNESSLGAVMLERADVRSLVNEVLHELGPQLAKKRLQLDSEMGSRPLIVKLHPMHFAQVIRNVVINAIKFSPPHSKIEVTGRYIKDAMTATSQVCFSVRDHGVGIPPDELVTIFEAFVQSSKTKDGSGGTGLGLAICRRIMDAHNGRIVAANMPDGGAVFRIYLPARVALDHETDFSPVT